jgi:hypothetical protein
MTALIDVLKDVWAWLTTTAPKNPKTPAKLASTGLIRKVLLALSIPPIVFLLVIPALCKLITR